MAVTWFTIASALLTQSLPAYGQATATLFAPSFFVDTSEPLVHLVFRDDRGERIDEPIRFLLTVSGNAVFGENAALGILTSGAGGPVVGCETIAGEFAIALRGVAPGPLRFLLSQTGGGLSIDAVRHRVALDSVDGVDAVRRWQTERDSDGMGWMITALATEPDDADVREGSAAWWSGELFGDGESTIVSVPIQVPARGDARLRLVTRYEFEPASCGAVENSVHRGGWIEILRPHRPWETIEPIDGYPYLLADVCAPDDGPAAPQPVLGRDNGGGFEEMLIQLDASDAGDAVRIRFRAASRCSACAPGGGWYLDDLSLESTDLSVEMLAADEDADGDELTNAEEIAQETNPRRSDTDGDGLSDQVEDRSGRFVDNSSTGTDPRAPDTDSGGSSDGFEVAVGSDPNDSADDPRAVTTPARRIDGSGQAWVLLSSATASTLGGDPLLEAFADGGGFQLDVDGRRFRSTASLHESGEAGELLATDARVDSVQTIRRVWVSPTHGLVRYVERFTNVTAESAEIVVQLRHEFFHDGWIDVEATKSSTSSPSPVNWLASDRYAHFNDRDPDDGMPSFLWFYGDDGAEVTPEDATLLSATSERLAAGGTAAAVSFRLQLAPGETRALLHFGSLSPHLDASRAQADWLTMQPQAALTGLRPRDELEVVNFALDLDGDGMSGLYEVTHGLDPTDPLDADADADADGLSNAQEAALGTSATDADTDGDGLSDFAEATDGRSNPLLSDSDHDGVPDGVDPFPAAKIAVLLPPTVSALVGEPATVRVRAEVDGEAFTEPLRLGLALEGVEAVFTDPIEGGRALSGLGTALLRAEMASGELVVGVRAASAGELTVSIVDTDGAGIAPQESFSHDFERDAAGFEERVTSDVWQWGAPKLSAAHSGQNVWATVIDGDYPPNVEARLVTPVFAFAVDSSPVISFQHILELEEGVDIAIIAFDDGQSDIEIITDLSTNTRLGYELVRVSASSLRGRRGRLVLVLLSDFSIEFGGWQIDDFLVEGLQTKTTVRAFDPGLDDDNDGLSNRDEIARGTDPDDADTDGDGLGDQVETATGIFVDENDTGSSPTSADTDGGGQGDGDEVRRGNDPNVSSDDTVSVDVFDPVVVTGADERTWQILSLGAAIMDDESILVDLGLLTVDDELFVSETGILAEEGQLLRLFSADFFSPQGVIRQVFVHPEAPWLRWHDSFSGDSRVANVAFESFLMSLDGVEIVSTSSGDELLDANDDAYVVRLRRLGNDLFLGHAFVGAGAILRPFFIGVDAIGSASIEYGIGPESPESLASLLSYVVVSEDLGVVEAILRDVRSPTGAYLQGLDAADRSNVVNFQIDSDSDGLPDRFETAAGLDPSDPDDAAADPDSDGLTNAEEFAIGASPLRADTDGDGVSDGEEANRGTSPTNADTDGDGIGDADDTLPNTHIVLHHREEIVGIVDEPIVYRVAVRDAHGTPLSDQTIADADVRLVFELSDDARFAGILHGDAVTPPTAQSVTVRPRGGWIVVSVGSDRPALATLRVSSSVVQTDGQSHVRVLTPDIDADGDGLPNRFEVTWGTDPDNSDTDGDGIGDRFETASYAFRTAVEIGTFPWLGDSDGGGLHDGDELPQFNPVIAADDVVETTLPHVVNAGEASWLVLPSTALSEPTATPVVVDNAAVLSVDGDFAGAVAIAKALPGDRGVIVGPTAVGPLTLRRYVASQLGPQPLIRIEDELINSTASAQDVLVELHFDVALDSFTSRFDTSSDDNTESRQGSWALLGRGDAALLHVYPRTSPPPRTSRPAVDRLREEFSLSFAPGEHKVLVHYIAVGSASALSTLGSRLLDSESTIFEPQQALGNAVSKPETGLLVWDAWPREELAFGETWSLAGEGFDADARVTIGVEPSRVIRWTPTRLVLEAPRQAASGVVRVTTAAGTSSLIAAQLRVGEGSEQFRRGEVNDDRVIDLTDALALIAILFRGQSAPECMDRLDVNDDGTADLSDPVYLLRALFAGDRAIPLPGGVVPGRDPTEDALTCAP